MSDGELPAQFEQVVMPHLDAAYNLAAWLAGNEHDAEDIAQEAMLRAFRFFDGYRGGNSRSWLLTIVRNTAYTWLKKNRPKAMVTTAENELEKIEDPSTAPGSAALPALDAAALRTAIDALPVEFREAIVLRELEGFSYKEIADVAEVPIGTVMSRLARARKLLQQSLNRKGNV